MGGPPRAPHAEWTVLAYMAADNDLEGAAIDDLKKMERIGSSPGQVEIVVQVDRGSGDASLNGGWHAARRYYVTRGGSRRRITSTVLAELGDVNTGDPRVLEDFLAFGVRAYPAKRYALIIWNHGSGVYVPDDMLGSRGPVPRPRRYPLGFGSEPLPRLHPPGLGSEPLPRLHPPGLGSEPLPRLHPLGFGIAYDDRSGDCLTTREVESVLAAGHRQRGRKIDLVGMDACLMAMLEIAWQLRDHVGVLVASEEIEPVTGWPYAAILRALVARPSMGPAELATTIVRCYSASYGWPGPGVTLSAIDPSRLGELVDAVDCLAGVLLTALPRIDPSLSDARRRTLSFFHDHYVDLHHFASTLGQGTDLAALRLACLDVMAIIEGRNAKSPILEEAHAGPGLGAARGLSIYFPPSGELWALYRDLAFAQRTRWPDFLEAYLMTHGTS